MAAIISLHLLRQEEHLPIVYDLMALKASVFKHSPLKDSLTLNDSPLKASLIYLRRVSSIFLHLGGHPGFIGGTILLALLRLQTRFV